MFITMKYINCLLFLSLFTTTLSSFCSTNMSTQNVVRRFMTSYLHSIIFSEYTKEEKDYVYDDMKELYVIVSQKVNFAIGTKKVHEKI